MSELVSVIVPVYRTRRYLTECVHSITNQSYRNIEVILVDDGSPDDSGELCDELALEDNRIKVIHKENGGLSDARNAGMDIATGVYMLFCDSDDWMESNIIEIAVNKSKKFDTQMVIWGYSADFANADGIITKSNLCKTDKTLEMNHTIDFSDRAIQGLLGYAWNKLYIRSVINDHELRFEKGISLVEDILFNAKVIEQCDKIVFLDEIGTHYMQRGITTLGNAFYPNYAELILQAIDAKQTIFEHFGCSQESVKSIISDYAMMAIKVGILSITKNQILSKQEKAKRIKTISIDDSMKELLRIAKPQTLKEKVLLTALKLKAFMLIASVC